MYLYVHSNQRSPTVTEHFQNIFSKYCHNPGTKVKKNVYTYLGRILWLGKRRSQRLRKYELKNECALASDVGRRLGEGGKHQQIMEMINTLCVCYCVGDVNQTYWHTYRFHTSLIQIFFLFFLNKTDMAYHTWKVSVYRYYGQFVTCFNKSK